MHLMLVLVLSLSLTSPVLAARAVSADHPVTVKLETSQPTAIALPEPVASVSVGVAPERFSLDYDGPYLFLLPLDATVTGRLFVVGQSGKLYTVLFKVATPADDVVHLTTTPASPAVKAQPFSVASFLRALRTQTILPGQVPMELPAPTLPDTRLAITDSQALALGSHLGQVLRVRNTQPTPLTLDLRIGESRTGGPEDTIALSTWTWPPRLTIRAVAAEDEVLGPQGETHLYMVLERRP
jgi:hypothetical protein